MSVPRVSFGSNIGHWRCLPDVRFAPQKRTQIGHFPRSEKCQYRTRAMQLLNHLVSAREERFRDRKTKQLSCFEIYYQLKFGR